MLTALQLAGLFTVVLGAVHFFMPILFDFRHAIPSDGPTLKPLRLLFYHYDTQRSDVHGIAWIMNHCVSYVLLTIGFLDLTAHLWLGTQFGPLLAAWIAGWWLLRAASQLYLGHRRGDCLVIAWFAFLAILHARVAALAVVQ